MSAALLNQGITDVRTAITDKVTHVGVSTASDAFVASQTAIDPTPGTNLIKAATKTVIDFQTVDFTMSINGTTEFTGSSIGTISILKGATRTDAMSRTVRAQGIGVAAGDTFTVGIRVKVTDQS